MDITHVLCFKDAEAAGTKAAMFLADGYKVAKILQTDIVICDDFNQPAMLCNSMNPEDWIVVIATKKQMVIEGPSTEALDVK